MHVWGGISARGATSVVIFTGTLIATRIRDSALVPFITNHYPEVPRFQEDNDPKHTSVWVRNYFEQQGINWWYTLPSGPDLNSIENVWGSLKQYLRTNVKPKTIEQLKIGIREFVHILTPSVCRTNSSGKSFQKLLMKMVGHLVIRIVYYNIFTKCIIIHDQHTNHILPISK